jgi:hypothetical protein
MDAKPSQFAPERPEREFWISIVGAASYAPESEAGALKLALPRHIGGVLLSAVPCVAVTLDRQSAPHTFNKKVDPPSSHFELRQNPIAAGGDVYVHVYFEPTVEGCGRSPLRSVRC